jgi:DNA-binding CsgD family transcriptional regulator
MPNPWQIARPLTGYDLVPVTARSAKVNRHSLPQGSEPSWNYASVNNEFARSAQIQVPKAIPGGGKKIKLVNQPVQQWLRWTHEATVISVERMGDGRDYVLTFETGQIGVILRPLSSLVNSWDVFVGYAPPAPFEPPGIDRMIDRASILPPTAISPEVEFGLTPEEEVITEEQVALAQQQYAARQTLLQHWQSLTPRQRQVVALVCQGNSTRQVATRLDTSTSTIRSHLSRAMHKFSVHSQIALCRAVAGLDFSLWLED